MGKIIGSFLVLGGIFGCLHQWMEVQKERQKRMEEFCLFLHRAIFAMESEKIKIIDYFETYQSTDLQVTKTLHEIANRLKECVFPSGSMVWEMVFQEEEKNWNLEKESFSLIQSTGCGFFGRNRAENISFLKKKLEALEKQQIKQKETDTNERKIWVPVSLLGGIMLTILFM